MKPFHKMYRVCLLVLWLTWETASSGENQFSDFQRQKWTIFFSMVDRNNDSVLGEEDYHQAVDDVNIKCTCLNLNDLTNRQATIVKKAWWAFPFDKEGQGKAVDRAEYWAVMPSRVKDPKYQDKIKALAEITFQLMDVDGGNLVNLVEYTAALLGLRGVASLITIQCFNGIDTNHDNVLQVDEYVAAFLDFLAGADESKPSKWIFGPLY